MDNSGVRKEVAERVFQIADELDWAHISISERAKYYEAWADDPEIGGRLNQIMDPSRIRVYLKDSIIGAYAKSKRISLKQLLHGMNIPLGSNSVEFIKPQALLCENHRLYTLTEAKNWRVAITSAYERGIDYAHMEKNLVIFTDHTNGRFSDDRFRNLISDVANRLDVEIFWLT